MLYLVDFRKYVVADRINPLGICSSNPDPTYTASGGGAGARRRRLSDFNWPQAAMMSRPRGTRMGAE